MNTSSLLFSLLVCSWMSLSPVWGQEGEPHQVSTVPAAVSVSVASMRMGADEALRRSYIRPNAIKGSVGESIAERAYLDKILSSGKREWFGVTPRSGPQGIDHVLISTDSKGIPRKLLLAESKYGSSRLGKTRDGMQMGSRWKAARLEALGNKYASFAKAESLENGVPPLKIKNKISLKLPGEKVVTCWRETAKGAWKTDCSKKDFAAAQKMAGAYSQFFHGAAEGRFTYRSRIFHVTPEGSNLIVNVLNADRLETKGGSSKPNAYKKETSFTLKGANTRAGISSPAVLEDVAREYSRRLGVSDNEARVMAKNTLKSCSLAELAVNQNIWKHATKNVGVVTAIACAVDVGGQVLLNHSVDWKQTGIHSGLALGSAVAAYATQAGLASASSSLVRTAAPAAVALAVFAAYDYYLAFSGQQSYADANLNTASSVAGVAVGTALTSAIVGLPALCGATTAAGTSIASLHGIALANATAAWWGGGAVAAGGGGMAVGAVAIAAVSFVVVTAAVVGCAYLGRLWYTHREEQMEDAMLQQKIDFFMQDDVWNKLLKI